MQVEEKGTVKSNDGEWCKRQVSGSYYDVIGQIQTTKVLTPTFLMQTFSLPCQEFYCIVTLSALSKFQGSTCESQGGQMSDLEKTDEAGTATILMYNNFFWIKVVSAN